jgi:hypothetical protein
VKDSRFFLVTGLGVGCKSSGDTILISSAMQLLSILKGDRGGTGARVVPCVVALLRTCHIGLGSGRRKYLFGILEAKKSRYLK